MDTDADDSRQLRHSYRELLAQAQAQRTAYLTDDGSALAQTLRQANGFYTRVRTTTEGILDSRLLIFAADVSAQRAHQLRTDSAAFDTSAYVDRLAASRWATLGRRALAVSRTPPRFACLHGPLLAEKKPPRRAPAVRRARALRSAEPAQAVES
ncbi:Non-structural maintenance of chromosomes element 4 A, partial [Coemansia sp. RSA 2603]